MALIGECSNFLCVGCHELLSPAEPVPLPCFRAHDHTGADVPVSLQLLQAEVIEAKQNVEHTLDQLQALADDAQDYAGFRGYLQTVRACSLVPEPARSRLPVRPAPSSCSCPPASCAVPAATAGRDRVTVGSCSCITSWLHAIECLHAVATATACTD